MQHSTMHENSLKRIQHRLDVIVDFLAMQHPELVEIGTSLEQAAGEASDSIHLILETLKLEIAML